MNAETITTLASTFVLLFAVIGTHLQVNGRLDAMASRIDHLSDELARHTHGEPIR